MQTASAWVHPRERRVAFDPKIAVASIVPFAVGAVFAHPHLLAAGPLIAASAFAAIFLVTLSVSPFAVSYRALGDVVVFLIYGPGIVIGTLLLFGVAESRRRRHRRDVHRLAAGERSARR